MDERIPTVTVVIPNHNYGHWLEQAVDSVIDQDYPNKQIIIVDDNSKDDSDKRIVGLYDKDAMILGDVATRGFRRKHQLYSILLKQEGDKGFGPSFARNAGIKSTWKQTHIFMFLDADDYWLQGKMSKSVQKILEQPERIGVVYTDNYGLNVANGQITREYRESYDRNKLLRNCIVHSGSAVTRLALEVSGVYDTTMRTAEDWDLWIRISKSFMFHHIPEPLVVARHGSYNSTNSIGSEVWQKNWQKIAARIREVYE
jgi:glycosyltransferase involved in cell wall biosynthesis